MTVVARSRHDERAEVLRTVAVLAGYTTPTQLGELLIPDVVLLDLRRRRLLVGDAKDTETPGNQQTGDRLARYAAAARSWAAAGFAVRLAVCHGLPARPASWVGLLLAVGRRAAWHVLDVGAMPVDVGTALSWADVYVFAA